MKKRTILMLMSTLLLMTMITGCKSFIESRSEHTSKYLKTQEDRAAEDGGNDQGNDSEELTSDSDTTDVTSEPEDETTTSDPEKDATTDSIAGDCVWTITVDDAQDYVQKDFGFLYHYSLEVNLVKEEGEDLLGIYKGTIKLNVDADKESVAKWIAEQGDMTLDNFAFNIQSQAEKAELTLQAYSADSYHEAFKEVLPDSPLAPLPPLDMKYDAFTAENVNFMTHIENVPLTEHDNDGSGEGSGYADMPEDVNRDMPVEILVNGEDVFVTILNIPLDRAFKGTLTKESSE